MVHSSGTYIFMSLNEETSSVKNISRSKITFFSLEVVLVFIIYFNTA